MFLPKQKNWQMTDFKFYNVAFCRNKHCSDGVVDSATTNKSVNLRMENVYIWWITIHLKACLMKSCSDTLNFLSVISFKKKKSHTIQIFSRQQTYSCGGILHFFCFLLSTVINALLLMPKNTTSKNT